MSVGYQLPEQEEEEEEEAIGTWRRNTEFFEVEFDDMITTESSPSLTPTIHRFTVSAPWPSLAVA